MTEECDKYHEICGEEIPVTCQRTAKEDRMKTQTMANRESIICESIGIDKLLSEESQEPCRCSERAESLIRDELVQNQSALIGLQAILAVTASSS